ncbi:MAG: M23 family peptidase, partial [Nitratireductor sp.]
MRGKLEQGAVIVGDVDPGAKVSLDGKSIMVSPDGLFVMGFGRDAGSKAILNLTHADGRTETRTLAIAKRDYEIQRINGVARKYVTPPPDVLKRIARERKLKAVAR